MTDSLAVTRISASQLRFSTSYKKRHCDPILEFVTAPILKLPKRVLYSFSPPLSYDSTYLFTDLLGPTLSTVVLLSLLQFGFSQKKRLIRSYFAPWISIIFNVLSYYFILSLFIFISFRLIKVKIKLLDIVTIIGYSFYGYIVTLAIPLVLIVQDQVFYTSLILFSGLSCMRVLLILVFVIETPIARFLICSTIGNTHMLFIIYLYYKYIHPTHVFNEKYP